MKDFLVAVMLTGLEFSVLTGKRESAQQHSECLQQLVELRNAVQEHQTRLVTVTNTVTIEKQSPYPYHTVPANPPPSWSFPTNWLLGTNYIYTNWVDDGVILTHDYSGKLGRVER